MRHSDTGAGAALDALHAEMHDTGDMSPAHVDAIAQAHNALFPLCDRYAAVEVRRRFPRVHDVSVTVLDNRVILNDNERRRIDTLTFPSAIDAEEWADLYRALLHAVDRKAAAV